MVKPTRVTNEIRALRTARDGMTQAELAERIGVTRQTVIEIEQCKYSPSLELAFQISGVFGVRLSTVLLRDGFNTATALSDGAQSLTPAAFAQLAQKALRLREALQ